LIGLEVRGNRTKVGGGGVRTSVRVTVCTMAPLVPVTVIP
jgi:hypothetical protein